MVNPRQRRLSLELLEDRTLPSTLVFEVEPNNSRGASNSVAFDSDGLVQLQGMSANPNDRDFFSFTVPSATTLNVNVRTTNGIFAQLEIEDQAGNDIFETQPNNGINNGRASLAAGTTYFLRMRTPVAAPAGYLVDLALGTGTGGGGTGGDGTGGQPPAPSEVVNETEPNNKKSRADAFSLRDNAVVRLVGTSRNKSDKDFFTFTAPQNGSLSLNVLVVNSVFAKLEIEDRAGNDLFETEPNDSINSGTVSLVAGQTYFARLRSPFKTAASYQVDLQFNPTGTGGAGTGGNPGGRTGGSTGQSTFVESEPNGEKSAADRFQLSDGGLTHLQGTSTSHNDKDFFIFTATQSGRVSAAVRSTTGVFAQMEVEDNLGNTIFETEPNNGVNSGSFTISAGRTYFVRMRSPRDTAAAYVAELTRT